MATEKTVTYGCKKCGTCFEVNDIIGFCPICGEQVINKVLIKTMTTKQVFEVANEFCKNHKNECDITDYQIIKWLSWVQSDAPTKKFLNACAGDDGEKIFTAKLLNHALNTLKEQIDNTENYLALLYVLIGKTPATLTTERTVAFQMDIPKEETSMFKNNYLLMEIHRVRGDNIEELTQKHTVEQIKGMKHRITKATVQLVLFLLIPFLVIVFGVVFVLLGNNSALPFILLGLTFEVLAWITEGADFVEGRTYLTDTLKSGIYEMRWIDTERFGGEKPTSGLVSKRKVLKNTLRDL